MDMLRRAFSAEDVPSKKISEQTGVAREASISNYQLQE